MPNSTINTYLSPFAAPGQTMKVKRPMSAKLSDDPVIGEFFDEPFTGIFTDRMVGLEIEVENAPGIDLRDPEAERRPIGSKTTKWSAIKDGSLRNNGAEFVSFPLPISELAAAVAQLFEYKKDCGHKWVSSVRTSQHVHVNVRDFNLARVSNLLVTYPLVEPALFEYVGAEREEGIYCVPWYRAKNDVKLWARNLRSSRMGFRDRFIHASQSTSKYSSLYLAPITRIGTVEFRHAPTYLTEEQIVEWSRICERIVTFAAHAKDVPTILDMYEAGPMMFVQTVTDGLLSPGYAYENLVRNKSADILARSLFPENLDEWVRLFDDMKLPKKQGGLGDAGLPIGYTKTGTDGKKYVWMGTHWTPKAEPVGVEGEPKIIGGKMKWYSQSYGWLLAPQWYSRFGSWPAGYTPSAVENAMVTTSPTFNSQWIANSFVQQTATPSPAPQPQQVPMDWTEIEPHNWPVDLDDDEENP